MTSEDDRTRIHDAVRDRYAAAARARLGVPSVAGGPGAVLTVADCCAPQPSAAAANASDESADCCTPAAPTAARCCGGDLSGAVQSDPIDPISRDLYDPDTPFDAALAASLGCGNPTALAELRPGEHVLDLGSGGGLDVLLSASRVAPTGHAFGLDMTDEMLTLARRNQEAAGVVNATFLRGRIEDIPLPDSSVDVVISNCVINLSPDKDAVLAEAYRVLRPGGRFAVADIVLLRDIPDRLRSVVGLWTGCVSGALLDSEYLAKLDAAGFVDADVQVTRAYTRDDLVELGGHSDDDRLPPGWSWGDVVDALEDAFAGAFVRASKPAV